MATESSVLVALLGLIHRIPMPDKAVRRARPRVYSACLFLKALVIMIVRRLFKVHCLPAVLDEPTPEMRHLRALHMENGRYPPRRTFERRLKGIPESLPTLIGKEVFVCDVGMVSEDSRAFLFAWDGQREMSLDELLEFRKMLEPQVAAAATEKATPEDLQAIAHAHARMRTSAESHGLRRLIMGDVDFLRATMAATHNRLMPAAFDVAGRLPTDTRRMTFAASGGVSTTIARHEKILRASEAYGSQEAYERMSAHLGAIRANV
ncbi:MAG: FCD domain-containing protein [Dehalococcoidales bacterium]|nr:FCD domain-containing protein [Dehalococcoidales bacterium]